MIPSFTAKAENTASIPPLAPNVCPVNDLVELRELFDRDDRTFAQLDAHQSGLDEGVIFVAVAKEQGVW